MPHYFTVTTDIDKYFKEVEILTKENSEEIDLFGLELDPDYDTYRQCFEENTFLIFEMRSYNEYGSELVGHACFFLYNNLQHKTSLHAKQELIFIRKDHRGHGTSFINYCDKLLKEIEVDVVLQCVPEQNDWSPVLTRIGYNKLETIYTKEL